MAGYLLKRLVAMLLTFWAMSFVTFVIMELPPGDYASARMSSMSAAGIRVDAEMIERLRELYRLNDPMIVRYWAWLRGMMSGEMGYSLAYNLPVGQMIADQLPNTLLIEGSTLLFMWVVAVPLGIYSAVKQYSILDYAGSALGFIGLAIPNFLLALLLMWIAYAHFGALLSGLNSPQFVGREFDWDKLADTLGHLWAPVLVAGTAGMAQIFRVLRANLLDELNKPYVVTARAKGLPEWKLILKYPVRIAINPLVSSMGWILPNLISASLIVATVMNMPTLGPLLLNALMVQDMYLAGGVLLMMAVLALVGTLLSDILLYWLDPRIRMGVAA